MAIVTLIAAVRIVQYNVHAWRDSEHVDNLHRVIAVLKELRPDVLCLNEVRMPLPGSSSYSMRYSSQ